jgi:hypothetical protein
MASFCTNVGYRIVTGSYTLSEETQASMVYTKTSPDGFRRLGHRIPRLGNIGSSIMLESVPLFLCI